MILCPVYILYRNTHVRDKSRKKNLIFGTYKPSSINNGSFLNQIYNAITFYSTLYKNCVLLGNWIWSVIILNYKISVSLCYFRSSPPEVFSRKGFPKICGEFTGEHPCRTLVWVFSCKFAAYFQNIFLAVIWTPHQEINLLQRDTPTYIDYIITNIPRHFTINGLRNWHLRSS